MLFIFQKIKILNLERMKNILKKLPVFIYDYTEKYYIKTVRFFVRYCPFCSEKEHIKSML